MQLLHTWSEQREYSIVQARPCFGIRIEAAPRISCYGAKPRRNINGSSASLPRGGSIHARRQSCSSGGPGPVGWCCDRKPIVARLPPTPAQDECSGRAESTL